MESANSLQLQPNPNATIYFAAKPGFILALRTSVGITCCLSIVGALAIIGMYAIFRDLRNTLRYVLVCVSAADILVAVGHLWGIATPLKRFLDVYYPLNTSAIYVDGQCSVQAAIAIYGTLASFGWTIVLAWFIFLLIACNSKITGRCTGTGALVFFHILCWGVPLIEIIVLAHLELLGFEEEMDVGWCYVHLHVPDKTGRTVLQLFSYELASYLTFILLIVFSCCSCCCICRRCKCCRTSKQEVAKSGDAVAETNEATPICKKTDEFYVSTELRNDWSIVEIPPAQEQQPTGRDEVADLNALHVELKLIAISVALIFLRIFSFIIDILEFVPDRQAILHSNVMVMVILAGIGDSAQGIANAIIFVVLTKKTREWIKNCFRTFKKCFKKCFKSNNC